MGCLVKLKGDRQIDQESDSNHPSGRNTLENEMTSHTNIDVCNSMGSYTPRLGIGLILSGPMLAN